MLFYAMLLITYPHRKGRLLNQNVIIDVRSPQEFANGHLEGAYNIPLDQLPLTIHSIEGLTKSSEILLYCQSGMRSAAACSILSQMGFERARNGGSIATLLMNYKGAASQSAG